MPEDAQPGVADPAAGGQPSGTDQGQPAAGAAAPPKEVTVPLSVVQAVREELSEHKKTVGELRNQLTQFQAMQQLSGVTGDLHRPAGASVAAPNPEPAGGSTASAFKDPFEGVDDNELVNVKDIRKMVQTLTAMPRNDDTRQAIAGLTQTLAKIELQVQDPQYETTIRTYLPEMITVNPGLRDIIMRAPNPLRAALTIARMSPSFVAAQSAAAGGTEKAKPPDILGDLQRIIENATKPAAPGSMGGAGAVQGHDRYKAMSDADFDAEVKRVLSQAPR